jgi:hypothetical protein
VAGRPKRRALRAALAQQETQESSKPEKPAAEMTPDELAEYRNDLRRRLRDLKQPQREADLRAGRARPRTMAEIEIFATDLLKRGVVDDEDPPAE